MHCTVSSHSNGLKIFIIAYKSMLNLVVGSLVTELKEAVHYKMSVPLASQITY